MATVNRFNQQVRIKVILRPTVSRSVGQSILVSSPVWGLRPDFCYCQTFAVLLMWGALFDERTGLSFVIAAGPRQRSQSRIRVPWTHDHILLPQVWDSPNLTGQVPLFISLRNRVAQLHPQALGSIFVASYDGTDVTGNVFSIIACSLVEGETTCPQSCSLATAVVLSLVSVTTCHNTVM
jgi:hypothetical protein